MNVVEEHRNLAVKSGAELVDAGNLWEFEAKRTLGGGGHCQHEDTVVRVERSDQQGSRASEVSQRYSAKSGSLAQSRGRQINFPKQIARPQYVLMVAGDEILDRYPAHVAVPSHNRANAFESCGQRNLGPAGNDMQIFPPTVAVFQILNDERNERQHSPIRGAAAQSAGVFNTNSFAISQVAAISRPPIADCPTASTRQPADR